MATCIPSGAPLESLEDGIRVLPAAKRTARESRTGFGRQDDWMTEGTKTARRIMSEPHTDRGTTSAGIEHVSAIRP